MTKDTVLESDRSDATKISFSDRIFFDRVDLFFPQKTRPFSTRGGSLAGRDGQPVKFLGNHTIGLTVRPRGLGRAAFDVLHLIKPSPRLLSHSVSSAFQEMATALTQVPIVWLSGCVGQGELEGMDRNHLERCHEMGTTGQATASKATYVSLESEIPEVLYRGMKDFIGKNPNWDQYRVMSSALAHFLFQNGSDNRAVTERYLDDLFIRPDH